jgi:hypothetical protein
MSNQEFCYWLQGYFELAHEISLNQARVELIAVTLSQINEPLGTFTQWLKKLIEFFAENQNKPEIFAYFTPEIQRRLTSIFYHVIDNSYETNLSSDELQKIHDGVSS